MFDLQEKFMLRLQERDGKEKMPEWPLNIAQKSAQKLCKSLSYESINELVEATQLLKNSKSHRVTDIPDFDREKFLEEIVDSQKYVLELLIFLGVTSEEFFRAYCKKDKIINQRIDDGY